MIDPSLQRRIARLGSAQRALLERRLGDPSSTGHVAVAVSLAQLGITHVYGVPGQPVYDTFAACARHGIRLIGTRHQHAAGLMAAVHNFLAGAVRAATLCSTGVPASNTVSAAVVARDNRWPLLILVGSTPRGPSLDRGDFMALAAADLFRPVTKWSVRARDVGQVPGLLAEASRIAVEPRPGPVLVELPEDVLTAFTTSTPILDRETDGTAAEPAVDAALVDRVAGLLAIARRPLIVLGSGVRWSPVFDSLARIVEALRIPFVTSPGMPGLLPHDHPLCMDALVQKVQREADAVLVLGARLNWYFRYGDQIPPEAALILVDAGDPTQKPRRHSAVHIRADPGMFARALQRHPQFADDQAALCEQTREWIRGLEACRTEVEARRQELARDERTPMSPWRFSAELAKALPDAAVSVIDGNVIMAACRRMLPARFPFSRLSPGASGCMGVGIPFAMAVKLVHPQRPVVAICGDYGFAHAAFELETAIRHGIAITVVIANNDGNGGSLRHRLHMEDCVSPPITMYRHGLRYDRIADVLGCPSEHVEHPADLGPALARAFRSDRAACVHVAVDPEAAFPRD